MRDIRILIDDDGQKIKEAKLVFTLLLLLLLLLLLCLLG